MQICSQRFVRQNFLRHYRIRDHPGTKNPGLDILLRQGYNPENVGVWFRPNGGTPAIGN